VSLFPDAVVVEIDRLLGGPFPGGVRVTPRMRMRRVACSITVRTWAWVPSSKSAVKKSHARIASA
jgi:hypothetical protein